MISIRKIKCNETDNFIQNQDLSIMHDMKV